MADVRRLAARLAAAAFLTLLLLALGCRQPSVESVGPRRSNVLLIVVDTLRADRVGCYGSKLGATPAMDSLAAESVRFSRAYSHAPWTLPAMASLLTAQPALRHGAGGRMLGEDSWRFHRLPSTARTIGEVFQDAGYATAAVLNVVFLTKSFGMTQGFEHVDVKVVGKTGPTRVARETTAAAEAWLRTQRSEPFFLLVHYFAPHLPYAPPGEFRRRFAEPRDREDASWVLGVQELDEYRWGTLRFDEDTIRRAERLYNGEVAYADAEVGRLLGLLRDLQLADSTIVLLTADHGEEFLDHGGFEHGHTMYNELTHVPLLLRLPHRLRPLVVDSPVGLVDVAPTLCSLAGIPPDPQFGGRDLMELVDGTSAASHPLVLGGNMWGPESRGWIHGDFKLVEWRDRVQLFDLRTDPGEKNDLSAAYPERVQSLKAEMMLVLRAISKEARTPTELLDQDRERLRSLGYVR